MITRRHPSVRVRCSIARTPRRDPTRPFGRPDRLVEAEMARGHAAEQHVAALLRARGLDVVVPQKTIRKTYTDRFSHRDLGYDILVGGQRVEVKHRATYHFTGPDDFPHPDIWLDAAERWDDPARPLPRAYILVSDDLTGFLAVTAGRYPAIIRRRQYDGSRDAIRNGIFILPRYACDLDTFVGVARSWGPVDG